MLVTLTIPGSLRKYADGRAKVPSELPDEATVGDLLDRLAVEVPSLERRIRDEQGALRRYVNLYVDEEDIRVTGLLDTPLREGASLLVLPSVAGGG